MRIMVSLLSISVLPSEKYCKALLNEVAVDILMKLLHDQKRCIIRHDQKRDIMQVLHNTSHRKLKSSIQI